MISEDGLHELYASHSLDRLDQTLVALVALGGGPIAVADIRKLLVDSGLRAAKKWNISDVLQRSKKAAISKSDGWVITQVGRDRLAAAGLALDDPHVARAKSTLRSHLSSISRSEVRDFVEEAISNFEAGRYRSAVVLSWIGAVALLYDYVVSNHLPAFNAAAAARHQKWKPAKNPDDLARMGESDFLLILEDLSIVGKSVKLELQSCLHLRNGCGHPNSLSIAEHSVASHVEKLILNIYSKF